MTTTMLSMNIFDSINLPTPADLPVQDDALFLDGFQFNELEASDEDTAKDIDDFTALLTSMSAEQQADKEDKSAAVHVNDFSLALDMDFDDAEAAKDVDDFAELMSALERSSSQDHLSVAQMNEMSHLLDNLPSFSDKELVGIMDAKKTPLINIDLDEDNSSSDEDEDEDMEDEDAPRTLYTSGESPIQYTPSVSIWTSLAPLDPRCCIKTSAFKTLDPRVPVAYIPKMDFGFGQVLPVASPLPIISTVKKVKKVVEKPVYVHEPATCWVCLSSNSDHRKRALHRYVEKRYCRNWKRGARYTARSRVASSRVREGGRFVTKCQWI